MLLELSQSWPIGSGHATTYSSPLGAGSSLRANSSSSAAATSLHASQQSEFHKPTSLAESWQCLLILLLLQFFVADLLLQQWHGALKHAHIHDRLPMGTTISAHAFWLTGTVLQACSAFDMGTAAGQDSLPTSKCPACPAVAEASREPACHGLRTVA